MDPLVVTQAINVLYGVSTLAVLALGLAVIFGLLGVLNIAHGEFVMIGAYCAYVTQAGGLPYLAAVPLTLAVCAILGVAVEWIMIRPLYRRPFDTLVATWGLSLLLRKIAEAMFGLGYRSVNIPLPGTVKFVGTEYPIYRLLLIAISIAVVAALVIWYGWSRTGSRIRAMVSNPELAQAQGISVRWLAAGTFCHWHMPCRARRRDDRPACPGAAFHGSRLCAAGIFRAHRRRPRQRCWPVVRRDRDRRRR